MRQTSQFLIFILLLVLGLSSCNQSPDKNISAVQGQGQRGVRLVFEKDNADKFVSAVSISRDGQKVIAAMDNKLSFISIHTGKALSTSINNLNLPISDVISSAIGDKAVFRFMGGKILGIIDDKKNSTWATEIKDAYSMDSTEDLATVAVVTRPPDDKPGLLAIEILDGEKGIKFNNSVGIDVSVSESGKYIAVAKGGFDKITQTTVEHSGFDGVSLYNQKGKLLWEFKTTKPAICVKILEKKDLVIVGDDGGTMTTLKLKNGSKVWAGEYGGYFAANDDYIIGRKEGYVAMFSINGDLLWKSDKYVASYCGKRCLSISKSGFSIVEAMNYEAVAFDKNGTPIWAKEYNIRPVVSMSEDGKMWAVGTKKVEVFGQ
ncbi:MAG: hypothetical protein FD156_1176 [Nitrospirae bacterium]|nr:MAG: hypothetical protein FD156_1176 [Nitrospirota bacterium]